MNVKFTSLLSQNRIQAKYIRAIYNKRSEGSQEIIWKSLSDFFPGTTQEISLLELAVHAMNPLFATCEILDNPQLKFDDISLQATKFSSLEEVLSYYDQLIDRAFDLFSKLDVKTLKGELEDLEEDEVFRRFTVMCFHAAHHFSQMLRLHGLITEMKTNTTK